MLHKVFFSLFAIVFLTASVQTDDANLKQYRADYIAIKKILDEGNYHRAQLKIVQLDGYVLGPYLEAEIITKHISKFTNEEIQAFITAHPKHPAANDVKREWLFHLAKTQKWDAFLKEYKPSKTSSSLQCAYIHAKKQYQKIDTHQMLKDARRLWASGSAHTSICRKMFALYDDKKLITASQAWIRFQRLYQNGQTSKAKALIKRLKEPKKALAIRLLDYKKHEKYWIGYLSKSNPALSGNTIKKLLMNLTHHNKLVADFITKYKVAKLVPSSLIRVKRLNAWYIGKYDGKAAYEWINLQKERYDDSLIEMKLRFSMQEKEWKRYIAAYAEAPIKLKKEDEWRYWYAYASKKLNYPQRANKMWADLADERHFYGFLAAQQLSKPPMLVKEPFKQHITVSPAIKNKLKAATEFFHVNEYSKANQQWAKATRGLTRNQWLEAGKLANDIGWYHKVIQSFPRAGKYEAIQYRFPLAYINDFKSQSKKSDIELSWLLSMARKESAFSPNAKSRVGALGLLQLMPATAKNVAKENKLTYKKSKLTQPSFNIRLAGHYLNGLLDEFEGNYFLATAAYNAGPHRVKEWLDIRPMTTDWVHWVATIPYKETRNYVQNIVAYDVIYRERLKGNIK